jgi:hypothetical protein
MTRRVTWGLLFGLALAAALVPLPAGAIERWYSAGFFPYLQRLLTSGSNLIPVSIFDALWMGAVAAAVVIARRRLLTHGWLRGTAHFAIDVLKAAAVVYLLFLLAWGLNYRRVPMFEKLVFEPARITPEAKLALGEWAVGELNAQYAGAHAGPISIDHLHSAFDSALDALGGRPIVHGRPKETLLGWYFHKASIAGMTDPFLLETMLAPDLLDVERPFVIAHEWAHLAGYADESEANFLAWVACRRGDAAARYSAALMTLGYAQGGRSLREALDVGPRIDLATIQLRYRQTSGTLRFAAREGYDKYLKANRVESGVESYDAVVQLILGTEFDREGNPRLR